MGASFSYFVVFLKFHEAFGLFMDSNPKVFGLFMDFQITMGSSCSDIEEASMHMFLVVIVDQHKRLNWRSIKRIVIRDGIWSTLLNVFLNSIKHDPKINLSCLINMIMKYYSDRLIVIYIIYVIEIMNRNTQHSIYSNYQNYITITKTDRCCYNALGLFL